MERECARTVRSSSKVSNPTFQPLIGTQKPPQYGVVPVIKMDAVHIAVFSRRLQQSHDKL